MIWYNYYPYFPDECDMVPPRNWHSTTGGESSSKYPDLASIFQAPASETLVTPNCIQNLLPTLYV